MLLQKLSLHKTDFSLFMKVIKQNNFARIFIHVIQITGIIETQRIKILLAFQSHKCLFANETFGISESQMSICKQNYRVSSIFTQTVYVTGQCPNHSTTPSMWNDSTSGRQHSCIRWMKIFNLHKKQHQKTLEYGWGNSRGGRSNKKHIPASSTAFSLVLRVCAIRRSHCSMKPVNSNMSFGTRFIGPYISL
jgi:hypothetical protein